MAEGSLDATLQRRQPHIRLSGVYDPRDPEAGYHRDLGRTPQWPLARDSESRDGARRLDGYYKTAIIGLWHVGITMRLHN